MKNIFVIGAAALCAVVGLASPAEAQIYSWRDATGVLTLSDRPQGVTARSIAVPVGSPLVARLSPHYEPLIRQHANQRGVRPDLVRAVIQVESAFNARAVSPKGAMGLMQLMPATAKQFGVIDPFNPAENIRAGVSYLRQLLDRYDHDEQLALAAYNAGPAAVDKYGSKVPPYKETQNYVLKITGIRGNARSAPGPRIYRVTEIVDGRPVVKYTNIKPAGGDFVEVRR
ncbi:MAG: lytic transglycosylase domain-containing protein [Vicinamibacterales bacterium]